MLVETTETGNNTKFTVLFMCLNNNKIEEKVRLGLAWFSEYTRKVIK